MSSLHPSRLALVAPITLAACATTGAPAVQQAPVAAGTIEVVAAPPPPPVEAKPKEPPPPEKKEPEAQEFGMIGLINGGAVADPNAPTGNMWGDEIGDSFGAGGLGLSGMAEGGGGRGEGIGLGSIGTLGHGAGSGTGQGFGSGQGRLGGGNRAKPPQVRMGATQVTGKLPPEVIQRIVRQNFGRFRLCYENGLRNDEKLQGKVTVKFTIIKDGSVSQVGNDSSSTMPDKGVVSCVVRAFYGLSFPAPEGGGNVVVVYPIMFSPGEPAKPAAAPPPPPPAPPPAPPAKKP